MRTRILIAILAAVVLWPLWASAQPMAENIADDVVLYIGWRGSDAVAGEYAQSRLKAILDSSSIERLLRESAPKGLKLMAEDDPDVAKYFEIAVATVRAMWKHPTAICLAGVDWNEGNAVPRLALLCRAGERSPEVRKQIEPLLPKDAKVPIAFSQLNDILVLQIGRPVRLQPNPEAAAPRPTLAENKQFQQVMSRVQTNALASVYIDFTLLLALVDKAIERENAADVQTWTAIRDASGLGGLKASAFTASFEGRDWGTQAFVLAPAPRTGILAALVDVQPLSDDLLKAIPQSATYVSAFRLDLSKIFSVFRTVLAKAAPNESAQFEQGLKEVSEKTGDLPGNLLDGLGDQWAYYMARDIAGGRVLGICFVNRLRNSEQAEKTLGAAEAILNQAAEQIPQVRIAFTQTKVGDLTIHYLPLPFVAPAWTIKAGNLYMGLFPQVVADAADLGGKSILDSDAFQGFRQRAGKDAIAFEFADLPRSAKDAYPVLLAVARLYMGMADLAIAPMPEMAIPPLPKILPHLFPSGSVVRADAQGVHLRSISPFPSSFALASPLHVFNNEAVQIITLRGGATALSQERAAAQQASCMSNLRQLGLGIMMYAQDHNGDLPPDLGSIYPFIKTPRVFICAARADKVVFPADNAQVPQWINANTSFVYLGAGLNMGRVPQAAQMVIAHEKLDAGHDGRVGLVFLDGHVEIVAVDRARELIKASREQINAPALPRDGRL